jgi:hypothetical protein
MQLVQKQMELAQISENEVSYVELAVHVATISFIIS